MGCFGGSSFSVGEGKRRAVLDALLGILSGLFELVDLFPIEVLKESVFVVNAVRDGDEICSLALGVEVEIS